MADTSQGSSVKIQSIDDYHHSFPDDVREKLEIMRHTIQQIAPDAKETISYGMPTFKLKKNLVHYAAAKSHIGFYPTPSPIEHFKEELKGYKTSKGAIQFPMDEPLPLELIEKIVRFRLKELTTKG